jgi:hypothetical protein
MFQAAQQAALAKGYTADFYLSTPTAVSEEGEIFTADLSGTVSRISY